MSYIDPSAVEDLMGRLDDGAEEPASPPVDDKPDFVETQDRADITPAAGKR